MKHTQLLDEIMTIIYKKRHLPEEIYIGREIKDKFPEVHEIDLRLAGARLDEEGYALFTSYDGEIVGTLEVKSKGIQFCQENSFSEPGEPLIKLA